MYEYLNFKKYDMIDGNFTINSSPKVLIWDNFQLKNIGGPMGYCYNIHEFLKKHPNNQIAFLSDYFKNKTQVTTTNKKTSKIRAFLSNIKALYNYLFIKNRCKLSIPENLNLNEFDYIHFHWSTDILATEKLLVNFKGKKILTSHCPCPLTDELVSNNPIWWKWFRYFLLKRESSAFNKVDYIMFPCFEAREPYEKNSLLKKCFEKNAAKFFYVPSAIMDCSFDEEKIQKFRDLGIPDNAFVITYFGRHNEIKGYDILKEVGMKLLKKYDNLYFLCAGVGPVLPLKHPRWIELGFINNTQELLSQSDLYILPNRETYFDLVVLEILHSSTNLLLSNTGGNKYFQLLDKNDTNGIVFFDIDNFDDIVSLVQKFIEEKNIDKVAYQEKGKCNRKLFEKMFTMDKFIERYIYAINNL